VVGTFNAGSVVLNLDEDVTCTITNDDDPAAMPVTKLLNHGTAPNGSFNFRVFFRCDDGLGGPVPPFSLGGPAGVPPCAPPPLTEVALPIGYPNTPLSVNFPPDAGLTVDPQYPWTLCDMGPAPGDAGMPANWKAIWDVTIVTTGGSTQIMNDNVSSNLAVVSNPYDPGTPDASCVNFKLPADTLRFEITVDNIEPGNLRIVKQSVGGDGTFGFTATGPNGFNQTPNILTVGGVGQTTPTFEVPGNSSPYTITETVIPGDPDDFVLDSATCVVTPNGGGSFSPTSFTVPAGKTVECTFINKKKGHLIVAKVTDPPTDTTTQFGFQTNANGNFSLHGGPNSTPPNVGPFSSGQFIDFYVAPGSYHVTESGVPQGWAISNIVCNLLLPDGTLAPIGEKITGAGGQLNNDFSFNPGDDTVRNLELGSNQTIVCVFTNRQDAGRFTGGGSIFLPTGTDQRTGLRITHGFELHCNKDIPPNNLEINWAGEATRQSQFHLESLTTAGCTDDPTFEPKPPKSTTFDTYGGPVLGQFAVGTGRYNGTSGYIINFQLTDAGEPGTGDRACYLITSPTGTVVLGQQNSSGQFIAVPICGLLQRGNHQSHTQ
jgi:phosphatidylserine decarboxylase